jgi:hypothetical protein
MLNSLNMIIIKHYRLERKEASALFYVRSREKSHCPWCEGTFKVIGSRKRILYRQDGSALCLVIRRLRCTDCKRISHELPDVVVPYKRHEADTIAQAMTEPIASGHGIGYCEDSTIRRWKLWFFLLRDYVESSVRSLMEIFHCSAFVRLPLYPLECQSDGWLKILVRNLVNSGRW